MTPTRFLARKSNGAFLTNQTARFAAICTVSKGTVDSGKEIAPRNVSCLPFFEITHRHARSLALSFRRSKESPLSGASASVVT